MTSTSGDDRNEVAALRALAQMLDAYGGNRDRWPAAERLKLAPLITESAEARQRIAEAAAFDALLDCAPTVEDAKAGQLARRIVAAAAAQEKGAVEALPASLRPQPILPRRRTQETPSISAMTRRLVPPGYRGHRPLAAAAMLAASLALGIFFGAGDWLQPVPQEFATAADTTGDFLIGQALLDDELLEGMTEEVL